MWSADNIGDLIPPYRFLGTGCYVASSEASCYFGGADSSVFFVELRVRKYFNNYQHHQCTTNDTFDYLLLISHHERFIIGSQKKAIKKMMATKKSL